jgi:hypothetical protein
LRQSAGVSGNKIVSKGRLYTVDGITFTGAAPATGTNGAPTGGSTAGIQASITLNAFIYKAAPPAVASTDPTTATAAAPTG